jgi:hypothetical protein
MPFGLGFFATAGAGGAAGGAAFDLLETQTLGSDSASVTFSSLSAYASTYQHLQLRITARTNRSGADSDPVILQFNGDTGSNYTRHGLGGYNFGGSTAMYSNAGTSQTSLFLAEAMPVASSTSNAFGAIVSDILDAFETTKFKTVRSLPGMNAAWSSVELRSGAWLSTSAVSSIVIKPLVGSNLVTGSRFSLYGIKAA